MLRRAPAPPGRLLSRLVPEAPPNLFVPHGESARGSGGQPWRNGAEAEAVRRVVDELLARLPEDATVGVVTPFRAQKDALARVLRDDRVRWERCTPSRAGNGTSWC